MSDLHRGSASKPTRASKREATPSTALLRVAPLPQEVPNPLPSGSEVFGVPLPTRPPLGGEGRTWKGWLLPVSLYLALPWVIFWRLWFGLPSERFFFGWQAYHHHWPNFHSALTALLSGDLPIWDPFLAGGFPLASDPSVGLYSPLALPFWIAGAWGQGVSLPLYQALLMIQISVLAIGFHCFFRYRGFSHHAAFVGALVGSFAGLAPTFAATRWFGPLVWTPWLWVAIERLRRRPDFGGSLLLAFVVGGAALSGSIGGWVYLLLLGGSYALAVERERQTRSVWKASFYGLGIALLWSSIVFLPWLELLPSLPSVPKPSLSPPSLAQGLGLFLPFQGSSFYHGSLFWILAAAAFVSSRRTGIVGFAVALGVVGFLGSVIGPLALADPTARIPGEFGYIYHRSDRFVAFLSPGFAILAACGLDGLGSLPSALRRGFFRVALALWSSLLLLALAVAFAAAHRQGSPYVQEIQIAQILVILGLSLLLLRHLWPSSPRLAVGLLGLLWLIDTATYSRSQGQVANTAQDEMSLASLAPQASGLAAPYRVLDTYATGSLGSSQLQAVRSFRPPRLELQTSEDRELFKQIDQTPSILRLFGVQTVIWARPAHRFHSSLLIRDHRRISGDWKPDLQTLFLQRYQALEDRLPRIAWFPSNESLPTDKAVFQTLPKQGPLAPPLFGPEGPQFAAVFPPRSPPRIAGRLLSAGYTHLRASIHAPHEGVVVINERFWPGWKAYLDGHETPLFRAYGRLQALSVPAGKHQITLLYRPLPFLLGASLWLAIWGLFLGSLAFFSWRAWPSTPSVPKTSVSET